MIQNDWSYGKRSIGRANPEARVIAEQLMLLRYFLPSVEWFQRNQRMLMVFYVHLKLSVLGWLSNLLAEQATCLESAPTYRVIQEVSCILSFWVKRSIPIDKHSIRSTWRGFGDFCRGGFQTFTLQEVTLFNFWIDINSRLFTRCKRPHCVSQSERFLRNLRASLSHPTEIFSVTSNGYLWA